jgi:putative ABC transport system ATP-binding protein
VGLSGFENRSVRLLSGGQRQRVAIARAIVNSPKFIVADEPTGALDSKTSYNIMQLFRKLHQAGTAVILVTHDENLINYCDRSIRLEDGEVVE